MENLSIKELEELKQKIENLINVKKRDNLLKQFPDGTCSTCVHSVITNSENDHELCDKGNCILCRKMICQHYKLLVSPEKRKFIKNICLRIHENPERFIDYSVDELKTISELLEKRLEEWW